MTKPIKAYAVIVVSDAPEGSFFIGDDIGKFKTKPSIFFKKQDAEKCIEYWRENMNYEVSSSSFRIVLVEIREIEK